MNPMKKALLILIVLASLPCLGVAQTVELFRPSGPVALSKQAYDRQQQYVKHPMFKGVETVVVDTNALLAPVITIQLAGRASTLTRIGAVEITKSGMTIWRGTPTNGGMAYFSLGSSGLLTGSIQEAGYPQVSIRQFPGEAPYASVMEHDPAYVVKEHADPLPALEQTK